MPIYSFFILKIKLDAYNAAAIALTAIMLAGIFQILFIVMRLGNTTLMSYTVISGFVSGVGVIIVLLQLYIIIKI